MDFVTFYSFKKLNLVDMEVCLSRVGYAFAYATKKELHIGVVNEARPSFSKYLVFEVSPFSLNDINDDEQIVINPIEGEIKTEFNISFRTSIDELVEVLSHIFECFSGYITFDLTLYSRDELSSLKDYYLQFVTDDTL